MYALAVTYQAQGRNADASQIQEEVLEKERQILGDEHPNTLKAIGNLASTYWNQGRWTVLEFGWARSGAWRNSVDSVQKNVCQSAYLYMYPALRVLRIPGIAAGYSTALPRRIHS